MLRPRHGMVDPRRLTSRTFAPLLYAITRQPSSFSSFARARAAEGLGDCHNALRANSIAAGFLACPDVLDHALPPAGGWTRRRGFQARTAVTKTQEHQRRCFGNRHNRGPCPCLQTLVCSHAGQIGGGRKVAKKFVETRWAES